METLQKTITWRDFATVKHWYKSLSQNTDEQEIAKNTKAAIEFWFPKFLKSIDLNPDELIEEAISDPQIIKERLSDGFKWCRKNLPTNDYNNIVLAVYGVVRGFYSHNLPSMPKIRSPRIRPRTVEKTDANFPLTKIIEDSDGDRIEIDREFLKEFFERLEFRDKVMMICMLSSSLDSGDLMRMTIADVIYQTEHERIFVCDFRSKTGEIINTFFSKEATKLLRKYMRRNRRDAEPNEPLFTVRGSKRMNSSQLSVNLRRAAASLGVPLQKGVQSPLRPKKMRKLFSDACDKAGIGERKRKIFMGKFDKSDKVYAGKARHELEIYYKMVEPNITIYSDPIDKEKFTKFQEKMQKDVEEIKLQQQRHEISNTEKVKSLIKQIEDLKNSSNSDRKK